MSNIRYLGKVKIIDNQYVLKKERIDNDFYDYLLSRDFKNFINYIDDGSFHKYPFVKDLSVDYNEKIEDMANIISALHNKTSHTIDVGEKKYNVIYENTLGYINYLISYYDHLFLSFLEVNDIKSYQKVYLDNYTKLYLALNVIKKETDNWYSLIKTNHKQRVCTNHGKLELNHFIKDSKNAYFISWDDNKVDSPISDLIYFYRHNWHDVDFTEFFKIYFKKMELSIDEKKLLFIYLIMPEKIELTNDVMINGEIINNLFDYIYKTEELIRPYYSK